MGMNAMGLPARCAYAAASLAAVGTAAFYAGMWLLPKIASAAADDDDGYRMFRTALGMAFALGFTAAMVALTLPWKRRKRHGRGQRILVSAVFVVIASAAFASQEHSVWLDLLFAAWLAYVLAFTYVRYGVLDRSKFQASGAAASAVGTEN